MGDFLSDALKVGTSIAAGDIPGAAMGALKLFGDIQGSGASPQQVNQQLAQGDQIAHLPMGTLENILKAYGAGGIGGQVHGGGIGGQVPNPMQGMGEAGPANGLGQDEVEKMMKAIEQAQAKARQAPVNL